MATLAEVGLRTGVCLVMDERDYVYGTGQLTFVISGGGRTFWYDDDDWVELDGRQPMAIGSIERTVSVRISALRRAAAAGRKLATAGPPR